MEVEALSRTALVNDDICFKNVIVSATEDSVMGLESVSRQIITVGICVCLEGETDIIINTHRYHLTKGDMCMVFPNTTLQSAWKSPDFKGFVAFVNRDLFDRLTLSSTSAVFMYIKENPCASLLKDEQTDLCILCDELKKWSIRVSTPFCSEISLSLAKAIYYVLFSIYKRKNPIKHLPYSRKNRLFLDFQQLIAKYCQTERSIDFYANKLCITPRYLSSLVKEISGLSVLECIDKVVIMNIQILLTTTEMSMKQISTQLNFPTATAFSKYFRRMTGMTPKECRMRGG